VITEAGAGAEASIDTQAYLEQWRTTLGLEIEVRQMDWASFLREMDDRRLQAFGVGWIMDYPDPENILDLKFHSESPLNNTGFSDPEIDRLLEEARVEQDPERRMDIYREVERTLVQDAVWIPLYFGQAHVVVRPEVQGWFEPPMVLPRLRFVEVTR
jgi:ABC-type oligopeptide transport system substrate-binding subunit